MAFIQSVSCALRIMKSENNMRQQEVVFLCFYCHKELKFGENCKDCDLPISWHNVWLDYEDKYLKIYKVVVH